MTTDDSVSFWCINRDYFHFLVIFAMLFGSLMAVILTMITEAVLYIRKQYIVRFTEHEKHKANKKKARLNFWLIYCC